MTTLNKFIGSEAFYVVFIVAVLTLGLFGYLLMFVLSLPYIGNEAMPQKQGGITLNLTKIDYNLLILAYLIAIPVFVFLLPPIVVKTFIHFLSVISIIPTDADAYMKLNASKDIVFFQSSFSISYLSSKIITILNTYICVNIVWYWRKLSVTSVSKDSNSPSTTETKSDQGEILLFLFSAVSFIVICVFLYGHQLFGTLITPSQTHMTISGRITPNTPLFTLISSCIITLYFLWLVMIMSLIKTHKNLNDTI